LDTHRLVVDMSVRSTPRSSGTPRGKVRRDNILDRAIDSGRREAMYENEDTLKECRALRAEVTMLKARESRMEKEVANLQRFLAQKVQDRSAAHSKYIPKHMPKGIKGSLMDEADAYVTVVSRLQSEVSTLRKQVRDGDDAAAWLRYQLVKAERAGKEKEIELKLEIDLLMDELRDAAARAHDTTSPRVMAALEVRSPRRKMRRDVVSEQRKLLQKLRLEHNGGAAEETEEGDAQGGDAEQEEEEAVENAEDAEDTKDAEDAEDASDAEGA